MQGKRIAGYTTAGNDVAKNECDSISINANIHRQNAGRAYARCSLPAFSINAKRGCSANRGLHANTRHAERKGRTCFQTTRAWHIKEPAFLRNMRRDKYQHATERCFGNTASGPGKARFKI